MHIATHRTSLQCCWSASRNSRAALWGVAAHPATQLHYVLLGRIPKITFHAGCRHTHFWQGVAWMVRPIWLHRPHNPNREGHLSRVGVEGVFPLATLWQTAAEGYCRMLQITEVVYRGKSIWICTTLVGLCHKSVYFYSPLPGIVNLLVILAAY